MGIYLLIWINERLVYHWKYAKAQPHQYSGLLFATGRYFEASFELFRISKESSIPDFPTITDDSPLSNHVYWFLNLKTFQKNCLGFPGDHKLQSQTLFLNCFVIYKGNFYRRRESSDLISSSRIWMINKSPRCRLW